MRRLASMLSSLFATTRAGAGEVAARIAGQDRRVPLVIAGAPGALPAVTVSHVARRIYVSCASPAARKAETAARNSFGRSA
jgi:hypothetical protein